MLLVDFALLLMRSDVERKLHPSSWLGYLAMAQVVDQSALLLRGILGMLDISRSLFVAAEARIQLKGPPAIWS